MSVGYRLLTMVSVLTILRGLFMSVAFARKSGVQGFQLVQAQYREEKNNNVCSLRASNRYYTTRLEIH
jgi:hypothetical protein